MGLYKRGNKWYCSIVDANGTLIRRSLSKDKRVAERILAQMREQIALQKFGILPRSLPAFAGDRKKSLSDIEREFLDYAKFKGRSKAYFEHFEQVWNQLVVNQGIKSLEQISLEHIVTWASRQQAKGNKGQSINQRVSTLKAFSKWAVKRGYYDHDPLIGWEPLQEDDKAHRRDLRPEEIARILSFEWDGEYKLRWLVYFTTALRSSAGASLSWEWIDWKERLIILPPIHNKSKKELRLPMRTELHEALRFVHKTKGSPETGRVFSPIRRTSLLRRFRLVCERAGIDLSGVCLHSVRHTAATMYYKATGNLKAVQEILGHSSIATTSLYLHSNDDDKRDTIEGLDFSFCG